MNKLTITLKQHTPLLHFQPMQEGATLRASEVKPKLDKFLIEKLKNEGRNVPKDWLLPNNDPEVRALNYKMRIKTSEPQPFSLPRNEYKKDGKLSKDEVTGEQLYKTSNYPTKMGTLIVGNIEGRREEELLNLVYFEDCEIVILTSSPDLADLLKINITEFFSTYNFGNRKSKGFGSYEVKEINGRDVKATDPEYLKRIKLYIESKRNSDLVSKKDAIKDVFAIINSLWKKVVKPIRQDRPLLGLCADSKDYDRIPSLVYFKPYIYEEEDYYEVFIYCIIDKEVQHDANIASKYIENYINKNINFSNLRDALRDVKDSWIDFNEIEIK